MNMWSVLIFIFMAIFGRSFAASVMCRDENGDPVDWYYLYKLPKKLHEEREPRGHSENPADGLEYMYISSKTENEGWKLSQKTIDADGSFPGQTFNAIVNETEVFLVAYNDETPEGHVSLDHGHTKGMLAGDLESGFWLIHSVPKYLSPDSYAYPETGKHYGQSFLCISLDSTQLNIAGKQLIYNEPYIYAARAPQYFYHAYPNIRRATDQMWIQEAPFWNLEDLTSLNGTKFKSFAKSPRFGKDLYEDWVAPVLDVNLLVETWRHGEGLLPTDCSHKNHVLNIEKLTDTINFEFKTTGDHSKWGVADKKSGNWICVGDINRAATQSVRGGGTVCQVNEKIAESYRNLIEETEPCPHHSGRKRQF